jgi:hypothetical protein
MNARRELGLVAAACLMSALSAAPAQAAEGFAGHWTAAEGDGSQLSLSVQGGDAHSAVRELDDHVNACSGGPGSVNGSGALQGDVLVVHATLVCTPGGQRFRVEIAFTHDAGSDTLTGNDGLVWHRAT